MEVLLAGGSGSAEAGKVFRNEWENWVLGFSLNVETTNRIVVELWAIHFGLNLAQEQGISWLIVGTESQLAYHFLVNEESNYPPILTTLTLDCRSLIRKATQPPCLNISISKLVVIMQYNKFRHKNPNFITKIEETRYQKYYIHYKIQETTRLINNIIIHIMKKKKEKKKCKRKMS